VSNCLAPFPTSPIGHATGTMLWMVDRRDHLSLPAGGRSLARLLPGAQRLPDGVRLYPHVCPHDRYAPRDRFGLTEKTSMSQRGGLRISAAGLILVSSGYYPTLWTLRSI
jgi:hypothetical protein